MRLPLVPIMVTASIPTGVPGSALTVPAEVTVPSAGGVTVSGKNDT